VSSEPDKPAWNIRLAKKIDEIIIGFRKHVPPSILAVIIALILLLIAVGAWLATATWPDFFSVLGFFVTAFGFPLTLYQLFDTKIVAELRAEEYKKASGEFAELARLQTEKLYRHCLDQVKAMLIQMKEHENNGNWQLLSIRINDLVDLLLFIDSYVPQADKRWKTHADKLYGYHQIFLKGTKKGFDDYNPVAWNQVVYDIRGSLAKELGTSFANQGE
jgi:hypothetical protein